MTTDWLDGFDRVQGNDSGRWSSTDVDAAKIVLHRTEGGSIEGAVQAYRGHNSWPHCTVDPVKRRRAQHVPLSRPARALRNTSRQGETNRDRRVFQVEIVGWSAQSPAMTTDQLDWLGTEVIGPLARATGTPLVTTVVFHGPDAGWTLAVESARQRLDPPAYDSYRGILGHQHVPENTHWDPGALNVGRIITAAGGNHPPTGEDITMADAKAIMAKLDTLGGQVQELLTSTPKKAAPVRGPDGRVWIITDAGRWHVPDAETLDVLIFLGQVHGYGSTGPAKVDAGFLDGIPVIPGL